MTSKAQVKKWVDAVSNDIAAMHAMKKKYRYRGALDLFDNQTMVECGETMYVAGGLEQAIESAQHVLTSLRKQYRRM